MGALGSPSPNAKHTANLEGGGVEKTRAGVGFTFPRPIPEAQMCPLERIPNVFKDPRSVSQDEAKSSHPIAMASVGGGELSVR